MSGSQIDHLGHPWDVTPAEARHIQEHLRHYVIFKPLDLGSVRVICGLDQSYHPGSRDRVFAVAVALRFPDLSPIEHSVVEDTVTFPYIPGLLSFREAPSLLKALQQLKTSPDVLIVDAQGYAHPRRFGAACHIGVLTSIPTIACAKSRLIGTSRDPGMSRGSCSPLVDGGETVGAVLRTRDNVAPVYVSVGHLVDLPSAVNLVLAVTPRYRIPEPLRMAHLFSNLALMRCR
ncbi:MAG: deoxyribonuclease V [bacterium JZ-2024 1]